MGQKVDEELDRVRDKSTHMRHDSEQLKWFLPSTFVVMMLGWQSTPAGNAAMTKVIAFVARVLEGLGHAAAAVFAKADSVNILPRMSNSVSQWLVPMLVATMILISLINALYQQKINGVEQVVEIDQRRSR
jgi:hypothetical protein